MEFGKVPCVTLIALFFFHFKEFEISIELICDSLRFYVINLLRQRPVAPKKVKNTLNIILNYCFNITKDAMTNITLTIHVCFISWFT